jgi:hypothetical protein
MFHAWFHLATESDIAVEFEDDLDAVKYVKSFLETSVKDYTPDDSCDEDHINMLSTDPWTCIIGVGSQVQAMVTERA